MRWWTALRPVRYTLDVRKREVIKTVEQIARALAQREANQRAHASDRPLPYPNPWDAVDPTKLPPGASDEAHQTRYEAFRELCPPPRRIEHTL